jgi:hypothetical protein
MRAELLLVAQVETESWRPEIYRSPVGPLSLGVQEEVEILQQQVLSWYGHQREGVLGRGLTRRPNSRKPLNSNHNLFRTLNSNQNRYNLFSKQRYRHTIPSDHP